MLTQPARRSFRRYVRLDCQVVREHDFKLLGDLGLDLSTEGMRVRAVHRVLTGEEVLVSFRPPRSNQYIDISATVSRVLHGRRPGDRGLAFGLEFQGISRDQHALLFEKLRGLDPAEALRPLRPLAA
jgi:hypothetical protein